LRTERCARRIPSRPVLTTLGVPGVTTVASDVLLIVEIADTTLAYDRDVKIPIYARHGIVEVWLFDLQGGSLFVHRDPSPKGYQRILTPKKNAMVSPILLPSAK
jgi:Uma2 family endonuclease